jgi:hypothetical protein
MDATIYSSAQPATVECVPQSCGARVAADALFRGGDSMRRKYSHLFSNSSYLLHLQRVLDLHDELIRLKRKPLPRTERPQQIVVVRGEEVAEWVECPAEARVGAE